MRSLMAGARPSAERSVGLLPDPEPRARPYTIISVDDHLVEPRDLFDGRLPGRLAERAPRVIETETGRELWEYEGTRYPQVGLNAVCGRPKDQWTLEPSRFDEMRRGCWDPDARARDMDLDGVLASLCFPSLISGFAGTVFANSADPELGLACLRAWNAWHLEDWVGRRPDRFIPLQLAWLNDPELAAADVRANAAKGFRAVSFPEVPHDLGLPSVHTDHWDPFLRACEETGTVLCLHNGSSKWSPVRCPSPPMELLTTLFAGNAYATTADWLWAGVPLRFPELRIACSEGGIGWVPMLLDRLEYVRRHSGVGTAWPAGADVTPAEALRRNFWFCTIDIPSSMALRHHIGIDHIMIECDYPHADSTWPDTQAMAHAGLADLPPDEVRKITWENASTLFRHPVPPELQIPAVPAV